MDSSFAGDFLSFQDVLSDEDAGAEAEAETSRAGGNNLKSSKEGSSRGQKRKASPHSGMSSERDALDEETPWCSSVDWQHRNITGLEQLNREVAAYYKFVQPSESEHQLRLQVVKRIASAISDRFKDATVHPFGSFNTRLYLPNG